MEDSRASDEKPKEQEAAQEGNTVLPKVEVSGMKKKKDKKYDIRSRIEMKNGKLNLSQMNEYQ